MLQIEKKIKNTVSWNSKVPDIYSKNLYSQFLIDQPHTVHGHLKLLNDLDKSDEITPDEKDVDDDAENSDGQHNSPNGEDDWTKKIMKWSHLEFKKQQFPYL